MAVAKNLAYSQFSCQNCQFHLPNQDLAFTTVTRFTEFGCLALLLAEFHVKISFSSCSNQALNFKKYVLFYDEVGTTHASTTVVFCCQRWTAVCTDNAVEYIASGKLLNYHYRASKELLNCYGAVFLCLQFHLLSLQSTLPTILLSTLPSFSL